MPIVSSVIFCILTVITATVVYLYFLGVVGLLYRGRTTRPLRHWRLLIIVPAHNEQTGIADTILHLKQLEPVGRTDIAVVADNCVDLTTEIARAFNDVRVLERSDAFLRGKGYALEWAFAQIDLTNYDAVAIVDADTWVEPNMAVAMVASLERGYGAVQVSNELAIASPTPVSHLQHMANAVENRLFWNGRAALHLPVLLRGTGMAIRTSVLREFPWHTNALAEDTDYAVGLLRHGVKIDFSIAGAVHSAATSNYSQCYTQKDRWATGTIRVARRAFWPLLRESFVSGRLSLLELIAGFFLLSRPMMIYQITALLLLSFLTPSNHWLGFWLWGGTLIAALIGYLVLGVFLVKDKRGALLALLQAPKFGFHLLLIQVRAVFGRRVDHGWVRTERIETPILPVIQPPKPKIQTPLPKGRDLPQP
jgi:cellulose synthase/poly-beta-1,6-N-acetylglucosamine synthase-like glycosyltransferase